MKKIKLYFICPDLYGKGGTENVLTTVVNHFLMHNYSITIFLQKRPVVPDLIEMLGKHDNLKVIYGGRARFIKLLLIFLKVQNNSRMIFLSRSRMSKIANFLRKVQKKDYLIYCWPHLEVSTNRIRKSSFSQFNGGILAVGSGIVKEMYDRGVKKDKVHLIYNPIDFPCNTVMQFQGNNKVKTFLYIGRIDEVKNLSELLVALSKIKKECNFILHVYGSGSLMEYNKRLSEKLGIDKKIIWHGWVDHVWQKINYKVSALVFPSKNNGYESFGLVAVEAMSLGIPCIMTNRVASHDIVIDGINGELYNSGDIIGLSRKLKEFDDEKYDSQKIKRSVEKFNNKYYFERLEKVLQLK